MLLQIMLQQQNFLQPLCNSVLYKEMHEYILKGIPLHVPVSNHFGSVLLRNITNRYSSEWKNPYPSVNKCPPLLIQLSVSPYNDQRETVGEFSRQRLGTLNIQVSWYNSTATGRVEKNIRKYINFGNSYSRIYTNTIKKLPVSKN